jgi:hypothetical protein
MPPFPVARYLVPADPPAPGDRFTVIHEVIAGGLPASIAIDRQVSLVVSLPSGLAAHWLSRDATESLSTPEAETAPQTDPGEPNSPLQRSPLRLYVRVAGRTTAAIPLVAGLRAGFSNGSSPGAVNYEVRILDWDIRIGNVQGAGNYGSHIKLAWRRADAAVMQYSPLSANPHLWWRLPLLQIPRIESWINVRVAVPATLAASLVLRRGAYDAGLSAVRS